VLTAAAGADPELLQRLRQEARTLAALNHPNLLAIYDIGEFQGTPFLVMELLEGETLRARLRPGPMPLRRALGVARQIARGLGAAHEQGVVHRDLKPENVFLLADGRVKILDFGLARVARSDAGEAATMAAASATLPGMVLGTVGYMAPEQVRGEPATVRSDLFALGAILYEMLAGRRAFGASSSVEVMSAILRDEPPEITLAGAALPPGVDRLLHRCLEKEPRQRFQNAADLEYALAELESPASSSRTPALVAAAPPARRFGGLAWAPLLVAALIGAGITAWLMHGRSGFDVTRVRYTLFAPDTDGGAYWSPDGGAVAYAAPPAPGDAAQVFVRYLNNPSATQLTRVPDLTSVMGWSGDSQNVFFYAADRRMESVSVAGGEPRVVYDFGAALGSNRTFAVSPRAWAVYQPGADGQLNVFLSPPGAPRWTPYAPAPFSARQLVNTPELRFSPDGKQLLLLVNRDLGKEEAWLLPYPPDPAHPPREVLQHLPPHEFTPRFSWMPDSRHILITAGTNGENNAPQIYLADTASDKLQQLTASLEAVTDPSAAPDGRRALMERITGNYQVVTVRLRDALVAPLRADGANNLIPDWALRQPAMIYSSTRSGIMALWMHTAGVNGEPQERPLTGVPIIANGTLMLGPTLAPDGDRIMYAAFGSNSGAVRIKIISTAGGGAVSLTSGSTLIEVAPAWSPDGREAAYLGVHGNTGDLMVAPTSGQATPRRLRADVNALIPVWSGDGRWIAYQTDDNVLHLVSPDGKQERKLSALETPAVVFSRDDQTLYGIVSRPHHNYLVAVDVATGAQHQIGDLGPNFTPQTESNPTMRFSLTPDGQSLTFSTAHLVNSLWMMENFAPGR
ncbi:MAG: protein kinase domain-containing protein, partial [Terriglobales bacterium]